MVNLQIPGIEKNRRILEHLMGRQRSTRLASKESVGCRTQVMNRDGAPHLLATPAKATAASDCFCCNYFRHASVLEDPLCIK
jgi:hypothetical protein